MMDINSDCPCKECNPPTRTSTCHGTCSKYISWKKQRDEKNERIYREKKALQDALSIGRKNSTMKRAKKDPWIK